jgi:hypothetical protein
MAKKVSSKKKVSPKKKTTTKKKEPVSLPVDSSPIKKDSWITKILKTFGLK